MNNDNKNNKNNENNGEVVVLFGYIPYLAEEVFMGVYEDEKKVNQSIDELSRKYFIDKDYFSVYHTRLNSISPSSISYINFILQNENFFKKDNEEEDYKEKSVE